MHPCLLGKLKMEVATQVYYSSCQEYSVKVILIVWEMYLFIGSTFNKKSSNIQ